MKIHKIVLSLICPFYAFVVSGGAVASKEKERNYTKWEPEIQAFEQRDTDSPPPTEGVLFVGSSSIRFWNLAKYFPKHSLINCGFGGSQIIDSIHFADRIILNHRPRTVIVYAGDNDIAAGKTPEVVAADFRLLVEKIHSQLPQTKIAFIAIKPSISRWKLADSMKAANTLISTYCDLNERLSYVDIWQPMLGEDGRPRRELFIKDGLHLNHTGYQLWTKRVLPHVQ
ncbi:MAG: SGNH/GDSL hydrolase family protein [Pirellulales bacterium]